MINWQTKKLGDLGEYINGRVFAKSEWGSRGLPIIRIQNLNNENASYNYCNSKIEDRYHVKKGDILISWSASLDVYVWNKDEALLNQHIFKVILDEEIIDKNYFVFLIKTKLEEMSSKTHGATMKHIVRSKFLNIDIIFPPLKIQKEIVAKLDDKFAKLREAKRLREEALADTEKILSQTLREIFEEGKQKGWEEDILNNIAKKVADGTHDTPKYQNSGYPLITSKNLLEDGLDFLNIKFISEDDYIQIKQRSGVEKGDLLIAMIGTIGNITQVETDEKFSIKNVGLIKPNESKVLGKYIMYFLHNSRLLSLIESKGATQKFIALGPIRNIKIQFPKISEQQKIVTKLDKLSEKIKALRELQTSQLADLKRLEKSYLHEAFNGVLI